MKKTIMALCVVQLTGLSSVWACLPDYTADIEFGSKRGEISILLSDGMSGQKKVRYDYHKDVDGAIGLVAVALASKSTDETKLQSLKYPLQLSLTKFINYWSKKSIHEVPKSIQTALVRARKLLAKIKEDKLSESDFAFLSEKILVPLDQVKSPMLRSYGRAEYDKNGNATVSDTMLRSGKNLSHQLPEGLFASAINREVDRGGINFIDQEKEAKTTCTNDEGLKTYAGSIFVRPGRGKNQVPMLVPPSSARAGIGAF